MFNPAEIPEMSPEELVASVEGGETIQLLDIRAPERAAGNHIDILPDGRYVNMRGSAVVSNGDLAAAGLNPEHPVAVVCDMGQSSRQIAALLQTRGWSATSITGGMARWMHTLTVRPVSPPPSLDHLVQFDRIGKGSLGYLLISDGKALIIDVPRNFRPFLDKAEELGAKVVGVAESHVHADYISGGPELAGGLGVPYYLHDGDSFYPYDETPGKLDYESIKEGDEITVGRAKIRVVHTPGHTLGSVSYLVDDQAALTGDFIFVRSLGRPDLGGKSEEWIPDLWASLEKARKGWAPETVIYPAHYSSDDERREDRSIGGVFSELMKVNEPLGIDNIEDFAAWVNARKASFPEAYKQIKALNIRIIQVNSMEADVLEIGKNECAVG